MRRLSIFVAVATGAALLCSSTAMARWISFEKSGGQKRSRRAIKSNMRVRGSAEQFVVTISIPGVRIQKEGEYELLRIPGQPISRKKGAPQLPMFTTSVMLPDDGTPEVTLAGFQERVLKVGKVAPSRGPVMRNVPLSSVPRVEGPAYQKDAYHPAASYQVQVGKPYIFRDVRGVAIRLCPIRYNPVKGELRIMTAARLKIGMRFDQRGKNTKQRLRPVIDKDFANIYRQLFVNHNLAFRSMRGVDETKGRAVIICPDEWCSEIEPLQAWRATKGLESKLVPTSQVLALTGGTELSGELLKQYLQSEYDAGGLTWVLLVGDTEFMPPMYGLFEGAASDSCMVMLEGDDRIPDAFISRFSAKNAQDVALQVRKTVAYESQPLLGADAACYRKAVGIASGEGEPSDFIRADGLRESQMKWRYDHVDQIYDPVEQYGGEDDFYFAILEFWMTSKAHEEWLQSDEYKEYKDSDYYWEEDPDGFDYFWGTEAHEAWTGSEEYIAFEAQYQAEQDAASEGETDGPTEYATPEMVMAAVNDGRGLINYIGHGSEFSWVTSGFDTSHVNQLTNTNGAWPMIWSVACVNGSFEMPEDCFAEAWLKAGTVDAPAGAIGMVGASTNMAWEPPCTWQKSIIEEFMIPEVVFTGGALHYFGMLKTCEQYGDTEESEGNQLIEQCIFFGDSSVLLRNDIPQVPTVSLAEGTARSLRLVVSAGDKVVKGATVVVASEHRSVKAVTNAQGVASIPASLAAADEVTVTVTGPNLEPLVNQSLVLTGTE